MSGRLRTLGDAANMASQRFAVWLNSGNNSLNVCAVVSVLAVVVGMILSIGVGP